MIVGRDLLFARGGRVLVDRVSLGLAAGRFTALVGPNGAGKSTLLRLLSGELRPDGGEVLVGGRPLRRWPAPLLAARRAVMEQASGLAFPFAVADVVRMGAMAGGAADPAAVAERSLARAGLAGFGGRAFAQLSGGEQQRVHFARALAQVPDPVRDGAPTALLLDEPTASLDIGQQVHLLGQARAFARAGGLVLAVLHDLNLAAGFADEVIVLRAGRIAASGPPASAISEPVVAAVYGLAGAVGGWPPAGVPHVLPHADGAGQPTIASASISTR